VRFIRRAMAVTEDAELREHLAKQLAALEGEEAARKQKLRRERLEAVWRSAYPTVSLVAVQALGPPFDPAACAGGAISPGAASPRCATTWAEWNARVDAEIEEELLRSPPEPPTDPQP
jgi:hypothetical protein